MLRDIIAQGPSKSRRIKNVDVSRAMLMLTRTARKKEAVLERANCNGVVVISQNTGGNGCPYRHTQAVRA